MHTVMSVVNLDPLVLAGLITTVNQLDQAKGDKVTKKGEGRGRRRGEKEKRTRVAADEDDDE